MACSMDGGGKGARGIFRSTGILYVLACVMFASILSAEEVTSQSERTGKHILPGKEQRAIGQRHEESRPITESTTDVNIFYILNGREGFIR